MDKKYDPDFFYDAVKKEHGVRSANQLLKTNISGFMANGEMTKSQKTLHKAMRKRGK